MKKLVVNDIYDFRDKIYDYANSGKTVYVALFFDAATALMRALLERSNVSVGYIDLDDDGCGYQKEYYVILDDTLTLSVERAWQDDDGGCYLGFAADMLLIDGDASYSIVKAVENSNCTFCELTMEDYMLYHICDYEDDEENDEDNVLDVIERIIDRLLDIIYGDDRDDGSYGAKDVLEYIDVINRRFAKNGKWDSENCYYFSVILKDRFPGGDIYYDVINGHFSYEYNGIHYDHTGAFIPDGYLVRWDDFDEYDSIQKARIVRDCIM